VAAVALIAALAAVVVILAGYQHYGWFTPPGPSRAEQLAAARQAGADIKAYDQTGNRARAAAACRAAFLGQAWLIPPPREWAQRHCNAGILRPGPLPPR
jgi:hypothetical protein